MYLVSLSTTAWEIKLFFIPVVGNQDFYAIFDVSDRH